MKLKFLFIALVGLGLSGCGSFKQVLDSNKDRKTEHMQFQINRISMVEKCYDRATTDIQINGCQLMQMQLQVEQGFTVRADLDALPATPEEQIKSGLTTAAKLGIGAKIAGDVIEGLNRPNDIVDREVPEYIQPTIIRVPEGSSLLN